MNEKTNFDEFIWSLQEFFNDNLQKKAIIPISLKEASKNSADKENIVCFYNGRELDVIDMDGIAKNQYKSIRIYDEYENTTDDIVNTTDGFIIDNANTWYFIEFKDSKINGSSTKNNVIKKAYGNWYMLLDILYNSTDDKKYVKFDYSNPVKFAKKNVVYILVCSSSKNPNVVTQVRNYKYKKKKYTPEYMQKMKEYLFKDAYVYTEIEFEREFVKKFQY